MFVEREAKSGGISHMAQSFAGGDAIKPQGNVLMIIIGNQPDHVEMKPSGCAAVDELYHVVERFADRRIVEFDFWEDDGPKLSLKRLSLEQLLSDQCQLPARLGIRGMSVYHSLQQGLRSRQVTSLPGCHGVLHELTFILRKCGGSGHQYHEDGLHSCLMPQTGPLVNVSRLVAVPTDNFHRMSKQSIEGITVVDHPLVKARVAVLRDAGTSTELFRRTLNQLAALVAFEATRGLAVAPRQVRSPLAACEGHSLRDPITIVPILRAGLGMAEALLQVLPEARVGHVGLARNEKTFLPEHYYFKAPADLAASDVFIVDPMLATGNSAGDAADELKNQGATRLTLVALVGCVQGATHFRQRHPDIPVFLAAMDTELNSSAYIVPGLGDAGDRYFGT